MLLAILLSTLQIFSSADSTSITKKSKSQARYYISQIEGGRNTDENRWALALLGSKNKNIRAFIEKKASSSTSLSSFKDFETSFRQQIKKTVFQTGASNLFLALLLSINDARKKEELYHKFKAQYHFSKSPNIDYKKISQAIINQKPITEKALTTKKFTFPHFLLLFRSKYSKYLTSAYVDEITHNWKSVTSPNLDLSHTLNGVSYFRALYIGGNYSKAIDYYQFLNKDQLLPSVPFKIKIYQFLDYSMYRMGYYSKGLNILRQHSLPLAKKYGYQKLQLNLKINKATYLYDIGNINKAKRVFTDILSKADSVDISKTVIFNNLALAYYKSGQYEKYVNLQHKALKRAKKNKDYNHQIDFYNNLYVYARKSNNKKEAKGYLEQAKQLVDKNNNKEDLGKVYTSLGAFYRKFQNNYKRASTYFEKAKKNLNAENNTTYFIELLNEQSEAYREQKNYRQAFQKQNQIIELLKEDNPGYLDAVVNKALLKLKMGALADANQIIQRYKSYNLDKLDFEQLIKAKTVEADYLNRKKKYSQALKIMDPVIKQVLVRARKSADLKSGFWHVEDEFLNAFELAVKLHRNLNEPRKAIEKLDQLKTINDASLYQNPLVKSSLLSEKQLSKYKRVSEKLDAKRKKLLTSSEDELLGIQQDITSLKIEKQKLDKKLSEKTQDKSIPVKKIQNRLTAHQQVLHITELKDKYYVAHISRSNIKLKTLVLDTSMRNKLSAAIHQVNTNKVNLDSLYNITNLLGIDDIPRHVDKLTIIPDSYFYQLPVDVLPITKPSDPNSYGEVTYAVESLKTRYLTSLDNYFDSSNTKSYEPNEAGFVGYGISKFDHTKTNLVPLPYTQKEVRAIKNKLTSFANSETFTNKKATKANFERVAPHAQVLHMATHSAISERNPMFSKIYLKANAETSKAESNKIFAYELFELNLNNEMIMLNSCSSGSGTYIPGTGIMGMSRALRYAGASSLVLNLWSVNDMLASEFATYFYEQLNEGQSKADALRNTKIHFLQTKNASPHFWGPYMLIGNDNAIVKPNRTKNLAVAGTFLLFFIITTGLSLLVDNGIIKRPNQKAA